mgnify:CR=1 FL=1
MANFGVVIISIYDVPPADKLLFALFIESIATYFQFHLVFSLSLAAK